MNRYQKSSIKSALDAIAIVMAVATIVMVLTVTVDIATGNVLRWTIPLALAACSTAALAVLAFGGLLIVAVVAQILRR